MHSFSKNFAGAWGDRGHTHTVSVAQRHIGLLQEWRVNLHFVVPCLGAVCTGFTSPRWKEANYSQITLRQSAPTSFCLCCLQTQGWTAFTTLHFENITLSGSPTNLTCLQHFFSCESRGRGQIEELRGKRQPVAWESLLFSAFAGSILRVTKENHLYFVFLKEKTCQVEMWPKPIAHSHNRHCTAVGVSAVWAQCQKLKMGSNSPSAKNSRGEGPKHDCLLISTAEVEKKTGQDPWVDLKDVFFCFICSSFVKVIVQWSLPCVSSNLMMNNVW